ncbi:MAG: redoxin domain-containing protein [Planctomycetes bacterium]|nr:redoxin domain-containing protein [Planctomycetota bacterium]
MKSICCILAILTALAGCGRWRRERQIVPCTTCCVAVGQPAPEITGQDIDGAPINLSDYRGKVVVLEFWGHW